MVPGRPGSLYARVLERRHSAFLAVIVALLVVRPLIGDSGAAPVVFSSVFLLLLLGALYLVQVDELVGERATLLAQRRRRSILGWLLAALAIGERLAATLAPSAARLRIASICWLSFFAFVTWSELRSVLKQRQVTSETISMAISVYLLFGITWGLLYIVLYEYDPQAFSLGPSLAPDVDAVLAIQHLFPIFVYFSLTTLSTIGFGDITPLTLQSRYAAVAEGITGQFYLAILVARLVGMQMSQGTPPADGASPRAGS